MKICILTAGHDPQDVRVFSREALTLVNNGFTDISLIAPSNLDYEVMQGIKVFGFRKKGKCSIRRKFVLLRILYHKALSLKADVYHCHEPHTLMIGTWLKWRLGVKVIYDAHEYHPEQFSERYKGWVKKLAYKLVYTLEKHYAKKADYVFTVCDELVQKFRLWGCKALLVPNYAKDEEVAGSVADPVIMKLKEKGFIIGVFAGGMYRERGIFEFIEAVRMLKDRDLKVAAVFAGWCDEGFAQSVGEHIRGAGLEDRVFIMTEKSHDMVLNLMSQCDFGFINDYPESRNLNSVAVKFYEYMLCSLPIYASDLPANHKILMEENCGVFADPMDPRAIADSLEVLCADREQMRQFGRNARKAFEGKYNWSVVEERLIGCYRRIEEETHV